MKASLVDALPPAASPAAFEWNAWVGVPAEVHGNCWEFVRQILLAGRGVAVPPFAGDPCELRTEFVQQPGWGLVPLPEAEPFDLLVYRMGESVRPHVGIVIGHGDFLHWLKGRASAVASYHRAHWRTRIDEVYRYR